jgi:hypothetical protein
VFGQCAGGASGWEAKLAEMDVLAFMKKWLRTILIVEPVRLLFVPRRIPAVDWEHAGIDGGILFDRCRIVACLAEPNEDLSRRCAKATKEMLKRLK